jgi:hypothetical protein
MIRERFAIVYRPRGSSGRQYQRAQFVRAGLSPLPIERRNKLLSQEDSAQRGRTLQPSFTPNNLGSSLCFRMRHEDVGM